MNWLQYLLEANLYLGIFYAGYVLFLQKETHHTLNRLYLLFSCIVPFVLPVMQLGVLRPTPQEVKTTVFIPTGNVKYDVIAHVAPAATTPPLTFADMLFYLYLAGVTVLAFVLLLKLVRLVKMMKSGNGSGDDNYRLVNIEGSNTAFSFFNYLFIGTKTPGSDVVIRHEMVHIRQKHSVDIVLVELIKIVNWFNPFIYLLQISLKTVHEYIADEQTATSATDAVSYSSFLVDNAYGLNGSSITHSFFNYNLLKKRIIMLNQKRSGNLARLKYLVAAPLCGALLCASTLGFSKNYGWVDLAPKHSSTRLNLARVDLAQKPAADPDTAIMLTSKGYKYQETGYLIKGKTNYRVIITEKNGEEKEYFRNTATAAEVKLLRDKYGYKFPKTRIYAALPPPPPAPPKQTKDLTAPGAVKFPPPPPPKPAKDLTAPGAVKFPPPAPPKPGKPIKIADIPLNPRNTQAFDSLYKYIAKYVRYPAKERGEMVGGKVFVNFTVDDGKITNAGIAKGVAPEIDSEVLRVIKNFTGPLDKAPKYCNLPVSFVVLDGKGKSIANQGTANKNKTEVAIIRDIPLNSDLPRNATPYLLKEVVITTYL